MEELFNPNSAFSTASSKQLVPIEMLIEQKMKTYAARGSEKRIREELKTFFERSATTPSWDKKYFYLRLNNKKYKVYITLGQEKLLTNPELLNSKVKESLKPEYKDKPFKVFLYEEDFEMETIQDNKEETDKRKNFFAQFNR